MKTFFYVFCLFTALSFNVLADTRPSVSPEFLQSLQAAPKAPNFTLLDVRSAQEFNAGHIKGAINISYDELADKLNLITQDKNQTIIVYCRSGRRAGIAEQLLREQGYKAVRHLQGDMNGWQAQNLPLVVKH